MVHHVKGLTRDLNMVPVRWSCLEKGGCSAEAFDMAFTLNKNQVQASGLTHVVWCHLDGEGNEHWVEWFPLWVNVTQSYLLG